MSRDIISVTGLGKKYTITQGSSVKGYSSLRETISRGVKSFLQKRNKPGKKIDFWALRNLSFSIQQGEAVGIIGRNGAGKSTLLKILSRITEPSEGRIELNGRVASLLEVGTGFHPELTGRENIFLNGSILGMKQSEIKKKFDEIVDFSGVENFLDTPVKRYSSGMYVRLAFSVAAHLEPEILVVDEVLAVGDAEFQKKCLGKMNDVAKSYGRTVLFVSHNLAAIEQLCGKSILLSQGALLEYGETDHVLKKYLSLSKGSIKDFKTYGTLKAVIKDFIFVDPKRKEQTEELFVGYPAILRLLIETSAPVSNLEVAINFKNIYGELISHVTSLDKGMTLAFKKEVLLEVSIEFTTLNFSPGTYTLDIFLLDRDEICQANIECLTISMLSSDKILRPAGFPTHVKFFTDTNWQIHESQDF